MQITLWINYKQTEIRCKKIILWKSNAFEGATLYKQKQRHFSLPVHQLSKELILIFGFYDKKHKNGFVTKFVGNKVTTVFM